jgi:hypothetical protein
VEEFLHEREEAQLSKRASWHRSAGAAVLAIQRPRVREVQEALMVAADAVAGENELEAVRQAAEAAVRAGEDAALVWHAVALFITRHPEGQRLRVPSLSRIAAEWVVPLGSFSRRTN